MLLNRWPGFVSKQGRSGGPRRRSAWFRPFLSDYCCKFSSTLFTEACHGTNGYLFMIICESVKKGVCVFDGSDAYLYFVPLPESES